MLGKVALDPRHDEWMGVTDRDRRQRPYASAPEGIRRQQRRVGVGFLEIFQNRERLRQRSGPATIRAGTEPIGIDLAKYSVLVLFAGVEVDRDLPCR